MIKRILIWWRRRKSEADIFNVLSRDQALHGFVHTSEEIVGWLHQCEFQVALTLHKELLEFIAEVSRMRESGHRWHNDDRPEVRGNRP
jgi:hypothetical protein